MKDNLIYSSSFLPPFLSYRTVGIYSGVCVVALQHDVSYVLSELVVVTVLAAAALAAAGLYV